MTDSMDGQRGHMNGNGGLSESQERLILTYLDALQNGDLTAQQTILTLVAKTPALEEALWDVQVAVGDDLLTVDAAARGAAIEAEDSHLRTLLESTLQRPVGRTHAEVANLLAAESVADSEADEWAESEPITLRTIGARLSEDISSGQVAARFREHARRVAARLEASAPHERVPEEALTLRGTRGLLARLGLSPSDNWLSKLVHDAIIDLSQAREQESFRLAAARRSRRASPAATQPQLRQSLSNDSEQGDAK